MRKVTVFNHVTLDGFFTDRNGDMSWAHADDPEWNAFAAENAKGGGALLLGRITYDLLAGFWPTPAAFDAMPEVAERMSAMEKFVFSRTMDRASWSGTTVLKGDPAAEARRLKGKPGADLTILGSGTIVAQLAGAGLIDGYQLVVNPIVLGSGRTLFEGVEEAISLRLTGSRTFANGKILVSCEPPKRPEAAEVSV